MLHNDLTYVPAPDPDPDGVNYLLKMPKTPVTNTLTIKGGRNVVIIGGEIARDDVVRYEGGSAAVKEENQAGLRIYKSDDWKKDGKLDSARIVHVEGLLMTGKYLSDGIIIRAPEADVRVQNCRIEIGMWYRDRELDGKDNTGKEVNSPHPDVIQPWGGVRYLRIHKLTGLVTGQGLMLKPDENGPNRGHMELSDINLREQDDPDTEYNASPTAVRYPRPKGRTPRYLWWTDGNEGQIRIERGTVWFDHPTRNFSTTPSTDFLATSGR